MKKGWQPLASQVARARRLVSAAFVASAVWSGAPAASADTTEPIKIKFTAPPGCPSADQFAGEVRGRTARARMASKDEVARTFEVTLARLGKGKNKGTLRIDDTSGGTDVREVNGATCREVVSALALIAALAIDPHASTAARVEAVPTVVVPPSPITSQPALELTPIPVHLPWWSGVGPNPGMPALRFLASDWWLAPWPAPLPVIPIEPTPYLRWAVGADVGFASGIAPRVSATLAPFIEATYEQRGLIAPSLRASFVIGLPVDAPTADVQSAKFQLFAGRLEGCPIRFDLAGIAEARPCAGLTAGAVSATGQPIAPPGKTALTTTATGAWVEAEALGRLAGHLGPLGLELQAGVGVPFVHTTYRVLPSGTEAHAVPSITGSAAAGASVQF